MLNEKQKEVVNHNSSLVNIAGPGSGKTHTLIEKISSILLSEGYTVINNMIVLTFTNAAAQEIKTRALANIDFNHTNSNSNLFFGTYHSLFKRLLKENNVFPKLDLGENPTITMPKEIVRYITNIIKNDYLDNYEYLVGKSIENYYINNKKSAPNRIIFNKTILKKELIDGVSIISNIDNNINYLTASDIKNCSTINEVYSLIRKRTVKNLLEELSKTLYNIKKILENSKTIESELFVTENKNDNINVFSSRTFGHTLYQSLLDNKIDIDTVEKQLNNYIDDFFENKFLQNMISFGDIMLLSLYSFVNFSDFRAILQNKFKYIFVDEFQDTNIIQAEILYLLHNDNNKICVIGDPYQSIYEFLGAKIKNILNANKSFNADTIQLIENYRSNQNIVSLTNELGRNMIEKIENWVPCKSSNKKVSNNTIKLLNNADEDVQSDFIIETIKEFSPNTTIGIINRSGNVYMLENKLNKARLTYDKLGGEAIGESPEIRMLIHLFIYSLDNNKIDSLLYILNGTSGIGIRTIDSFEKDKLKSLKDINHKFKIPKKIEKVIQNLTLAVGSDFEEKLFDDTLNLNLVVSNIKKYYDNELFPNLSKNWKISRVKEAEEKISILFDEINEKVDVSSILSLLEDYITGSKRGNKDVKEKITVSTIHSSKGLEWDVVFLMNWDKKSFERDNPKEAQRLSYVAASRAKEHLFILSNTNRYFEISDKFISENPDLFVCVNDEDDTETQKLIITFGKYNGQSIYNVPYNYLEWIYNNKEDLLSSGRITKEISDKISNLF